MSIPPGQTPLGGYYGGPPPPGGYYGAAPPPTKSGGPWKALGIGCAALFVLILIGGVILVRSVKSQIDHPSKNSILGIGITAGKAGMDGVRIQQAVVLYHQQNGKYPASLMTMVQDGSLDGKLLHNDLDDSPDPVHVSWQYAPPDEGAPGETPILQEKYHITIGGSSAPGKIVISLNGHSQSNTTNPQAQPGG